MRRRVKQVIVVFVIVFAAAQLVRPERANPPTDTRRTIQAQAGTTSELAAVLDRSCRDCHSNNTVWPWYTQVAPLSWLMASGVAEGRKAVNFCMKKDGEICLVAPGSPRCWAVSSSDTAPVLWSLGASVRIAGPAGERTIPVSSLYQDDGI